MDTTFISRCLKQLTEKCWRLLTWYDPRFCCFLLVASHTCWFASVIIDNDISDERGPLGSGNPSIGTRYLRIDIIIHTLLSSPSSCTRVAS